VSFGTSASGGKYYLEDTTRRLGTYSYRNTQIALFVLTDTDDVWAQDAAMDAQWGASKVYDYYKNVHGRDGIIGNNGSGSITATANSSIKLVASGVHYGVNYTQAYWDGSMMRYGDGDGSTFLPLVSLDLCAHEMTHGVIQSTANLTYQGESGALNESIADIFGALIEFYVKGDANKMWLIGEEIYTPGKSGDALRFLNDPTKAGDPDHYSKRYTGTQDNGGVHTNSGIPNKWFYLLAAGGSHSGGSVTGIGAEKAGKIVYRALTTYLTSSSKFAAARTATEKAANDLHGSGSAESKAVSQAWYLVGVGSKP
jgi:Zn-dependent metalloprotease